MRKIIFTSLIIIISYNFVYSVNKDNIFSILQVADAYRKSNNTESFQPLVERLNSYLLINPLSVQGVKESAAVENYLKKFPSIFCGMHSKATNRKPGKISVEIEIACRNLSLVSSFYADVKIDDSIKLPPGKQSFKINAVKRVIKFNIDLPSKINKEREYPVKINLLYHADKLNERLMSRFLILDYNHLQVLPKAFSLNKKTLSTVSIGRNSRLRPNHNYRKRITVYFRSGSSQLTSKGLSRLQKLRLGRNAKVTIDGYGDNTGSKRSSRTLALARAKMVARYLKRKRGRFKFKIRSFGSKQSKKERKNFRRVVITVH